MIRQQARPEALPPAPPDTPVDLTPPPLVYEAVPVFGTPDNFYTLDSGGFYSADTGTFYGGGGGWLPAPCAACCVPPVTPVTPPVPEPSTWVVLAAGLLMLRRATRA
jgi:hypothetical protein